MAADNTYNLKDYALVANHASHAAAAACATFAIPSAGRIVGIYIVSGVANTTGISVLTFSMGGATLVFQRASDTANTVAIPADDAIGDCYVCVMDDSSAANLALEAEDLDEDDGGSVLTCNADGNGTAGYASITVMIRPIG
jgi:hypothetical protein